MQQNNKEKEYVLWGSQSFTMEKVVGFLMPHLKDKLDDLFSGYPGQLMSFILKTSSKS